MIRHLAYVLTGLSQRTRIASASSSICVLRLFAKSERVCVCVCVYVCVRCMCAFVFSQRIQTKLTIFYFIRSKLDYVINHKRCLGTSTKMVFFQQKTFQILFVSMVKHQLIFDLCFCLYRNDTQQNSSSGVPSMEPGKLKNSTNYLQKNISSSNFQTEPSRAIGQKWSNNSIR